MIGLDGEKMSKSRGNLVFVSKLRGAGVDPMAIRLALLDGHYRADREWTGGRLPQAERRLARWRRGGGDCRPAPDAPAAAGPAARPAGRRPGHRRRDQRRWTGGPTRPLEQHGLGRRRRPRRHWWPRTVDALLGVRL